MYIGLYYLTNRNNALRPFTDVSQHDLIVLNMLRAEGRPVHYKRLYDLVAAKGFTLSTCSLSGSLNHAIDNKYVTRQQVAGNVLYALTLDGKRLLYNIAMELDNIVKADILRYGNGFPDL